MSALRTQISEKRTILRDLYGGMMTLADLSKELGMRPEEAKVWAFGVGVGSRIGKRVKYETDEVARIIVNGRGMY